MAKTTFDKIRTQLLNLWMRMSAFPQVPGPKLSPFDTKGRPFKLKFLSHIGEGVHAHIWKVKINGELYALKIVCARFRHNTTLKCS